MAKGREGWIDDGIEAMVWEERGSFWEWRCLRVVRMGREG